MYFEDFRLLLLENLRRRVHNGEVTERGLAKFVGVSQPHMHNLLNGTRMLSPEMGDRILYHLRLSLLDLCEPGTFDRYVRGEGNSASYTYLPLLKGRAGPRHAWPAESEERQRVPVAASIVAGMWRPVVCRLAEDPSMHPLFTSADLAVLDQGHAARTQIAENRLYLIKKDNSGCIRYVRRSGPVFKLFTEQTRNRPEEWQQLSAHETGIGHVIRARVTLIGPEDQWT